MILHELSIDSFKIWIFFLDKKKNSFLQKKRKKINRTKSLEKKNAFLDTLVLEKKQFGC